MAGAVLGLNFCAKNPLSNQAHTKTSKNYEQKQKIFYSKPIFWAILSKQLF
jgi:hypothetical protein